MTPNPSTIGPLAPGQRWSVGRKREVVLRLLGWASSWSFCRGSLACRSTSSNNGGRRRTPPGRGAEGARKRPRERRTGRRDAAHRRAQHGGRAAARQNRASRPFGPQEVAVMAEATSPTTGRRYGVARVCQIWDQPRSSFLCRAPAAGGRRRASVGLGAPRAQAQRRRRGVARRHRRRPRAIPVDRRRTPEGLGQAACDRGRAGVTQTPAAARCASMACCRPIALARAPTRRTIGGSSPRRRM